ncbi:MAG: hypothetical protein EBR82_61530 [Caulobacteraceae bacterium]|nr:hypothetical protein [Caulobacteraceae bacterium]NDC56039.1 hypothetical protein [Alphaproteobacteria bacterium]NDG03132.1 hypothetical protein [Synechococcaceae bacterium WBB_34_004]
MPTRRGKQVKECENSSTAYFDECDECGELSACICLGSLVDEWEIEQIGKEGDSFAYRYQFKEKAGDLIARFGYASTYREAMDNIAYSVQCKEESK